MKIAVALSLLAAICTIYADEDEPALDKLKAEIKAMSNLIEDNLLELNSIRYRIEEITGDEITAEWRKQDDTFRDFVNILVVTMRKEVNTAKQKGVDAQYCFDANYEGVKLIVEQANEDAITCKEKSYNTLKENLKFINDVKARGEMIKDDLNGVEVWCHSGDINKMTICLSTELLRIKKDVEALKTDIDQVAIVAETAADYVILEARKCFEAIYDMAHFNCEASGRSHTGCVKRAIEEAGNKRRISPKLIQ